MSTFWDAAARADLCRRIDRLTPDATRAWGTFTVAQMVAHLNDALRMSIGELPVAPKRGPLRYWPIRPLIIHVLPFPKGAPTAPELLARGDRAVLPDEQAAFHALAARVAAKLPSSGWPDHPAFGRLSHKDWGVLAYRHTDHHLRQFGV